MALRRLFAARVGIRLGVGGRRTENNGLEEEQLQWTESSRGAVDRWAVSVSVTGWADV